MEYTDLAKLPYFEECAKIVRSLGYELAELNISRKSGGGAKARAVISGSKDVGIDDCASVHRILQARLEALLGSGDLYMEVTSPGIGRVLKHAGEFKVFEGRGVRIWHIPQAGWIEGKIVSSDCNSVVLSGKDGQQKEYPYREISKAKLSDFFDEENS